MLVTLLIMLITYLMGYLFNAIDKSTVFALVVFIAMLFNIVFNFIFIKKFGYIGASYVRLLTELLAFLLFVYFMWRIGKFLPLKSLIKPFIAAIVMGLVIYFAWFLNLLILVPFAAAAYTLSLFVLGGVGKEELAIIKSVFSKKVR